MREGTILYSDAKGLNEIGRITSGGFGPTFGGPLSMGYIEAKYSLKETQIFGAVRDKLLPAVIVSLPFVNTNFKR